jgi:hypothetical protein
VAKRRTQSKQNDISATTIAERSERSPGVRKLTQAQRAIVESAVARLHTTEAVQESLRAEWPDLPEISDEMVRRYRRQVQSEITVTAQQSRSAALIEGLALKSVRLGLLERLYSRLERQPFSVATSQQMTNILAQIAKETGAEMPGTVIPIQVNVGAPQPSASPELVADLKRQLGEKIQALADRRAAALFAESGLPR